LDSLLLEKARIAIRMPDLGYSWNEEDISGTPDSGSIWVLHQKMIYYFVHWGPIEVAEITPEYAAHRIPTLWPSESLSVQRTKPMTVAGHPAVYAEALPGKPFYRAQFLIWNCSESKRQFIADMNYNVSYRTPISELQTQIDATTKTLACHDGAPIAQVPGHVSRYDQPRFGLSFSHPLRWYVFESPYAVSHPAYQGLRDSTIGSVLAWLKDRRVRIGFIWTPLPQPTAEDTTLMAGSVQKARAVMALTSELEKQASFVPWASEEVTIGKRQVLKVLCSATRKPQGDPPREQVLEGQAAFLLIDRPEQRQRLFVIVWIDNSTIGGLSLPPERYLFDRWAVDIVSGLKR
jgi:hypothetical protein